MGIYRATNLASFVFKSDHEKVFDKYSKAFNYDQSPFLGTSKPIQKIMKKLIILVLITMILPILSKAETPAPPTSKPPLPIAPWTNNDIWQALGSGVDDPLWYLYLDHAGSTTPLPENSPKPVDSPSIRYLLPAIANVYYTDMTGRQIPIKDGDLEFAYKGVAGNVSEKAKIKNGVAIAMFKLQQKPGPGDTIQVFDAHGPRTNPQPVPPESYFKTDIDYSKPPLP